MQKQTQLKSVHMKFMFECSRWAERQRTQIEGKYRAQRYRNKTNRKSVVSEKEKHVSPSICRGERVRIRETICDCGRSVLGCSSNLVRVISAFMLFHNTAAKELHHKATPSTGSATRYPPASSTSQSQTWRHICIRIAGNCVKQLMSHLSSDKLN